MNNLHTNENVIKIRKGAINEMCYSTRLNIKLHKVELYGTRLDDLI
jgi:hypothetical protein